MIMKIMSLVCSMLYECRAHVCTIVHVHWKDKTWEDTASEHGYSIHVLLKRPIRIDTSL